MERGRNVSCSVDTQNVVSQNKFLLKWPEAKKNQLFLPLLLRCQLHQITLYSSQVKTCLQAVAMEQLTHRELGSISQYLVTRFWPCFPPCPWAGAQEFLGLRRCCCSLFSYTSVPSGGVRPSSRVVFYTLCLQQSSDFLLLILSRPLRVMEELWLFCNCYLYRHLLLWLFWPLGSSCSFVILFFRLAVQYCCVCSSCASDFILQSHRDLWQFVLSAHWHSARAPPGSTGKALHFSMNILASLVPVTALGHNYMHDLITLLVK